MAIVTFLDMGKGLDKLAVDGLTLGSRPFRSSSYGRGVEPPTPQQF